MLRSKDTSEVAGTCRPRTEDPLVPSPQASPLLPPASGVSDAGRTGGRGISCAGQTAGGRGVLVAGPHLHWEPGLGTAAGCTGAAVGYKQGVAACRPGAKGLNKTYNTYIHTYMLVIYC